jgi:hypothetical protein
MERLWSWCRAPNKCQNEFIANANYESVGSDYESVGADYANFI